MAEIIWTEPTLQELDSIAEYIALDNVVAASALIEEVFEKMERLENFPQSGRTPPELPNSVYREVVVSPCRVFYREEGRHVFILYVMREEAGASCLHAGKQLTRRGTRMSSFRCV